MKKVLFIDRDGTLVKEPPEDYQLNSLEKLEFYPKVFSFLPKIRKEMDFEFVMVSNQDGLGTNSFPFTDFLPAHNKILKSFENEGVIFDDILIDKSLPEENTPTRKPGTAMLQKYIYGDYNLSNSFVIGDRKTDVQLAKNLGCRSIYISNEKYKEADFVTNDWEEIYDYLKLRPRKAILKRKTKETDIRLELNLDGKGKSKINTGTGFFNHLLEQIAKHASVDIFLEAKGDLETDEHHTVEDVAIVLGQAFVKALSDKKGIERYGFILPMDDCLAQVAIDFGGRPWLVWDFEFKREKIGELPTEMIMHFFKSFSDNAKCNLNIKAEGDNEHHKAEAIFKAFAKSIKMAVKKGNDNSVPSTKGKL